MYFFQLFFLTLFGEDRTVDVQETRLRVGSEMWKRGHSSDLNPDHRVTLVPKFLFSICKSIVVSFDQSYTRKQLDVTPVY